MRPGRWLVGSLSCVFASVATAQEPSPRILSDAEETRVLAAYGDCVVARHREVATFFLVKMVSDSDADRRRVKSLKDGRCLNAGEEMRVGELRLAIAIGEAMFRTTVARRPALDVGSIPPLSQPAYPNAERWRGFIAAEKRPGKRKELELHFARLNAEGVQLRIGECVVRQDAAGALRLALTRPGLPEEAHEMNALRPALSTCVSGLDRVRFDRVLLRGVIGLNYVRLALVRDAATNGTN